MAFNLNQSHWANMPAANVDWAALAQQWIQMRETLPPDQLSMLPEAPPPPMISTPTLHADEQGEAPMEVEKDDEPPVQQFHQQPQENTNSNWSSRAPQQPWENPPWQIWENQNQQQPQHQQHKARPPPLIPELQGYKRKFKQIEVPAPPVIAPIIQEEENQLLDAAKRKKLPAWIREGLEKMEREKHREVEKQREEEERKRILEEKKRMEAEALRNMESTQFLKSKFDSDNEEEVEPEPESEPPSIAPTRSPTPELIRPTLTRDEQVQTVMLTVRKTLTEILLEVTNEEIQSIASETCAKYKNRVHRAQPLRKTALTSITGSLGLGIYGNSSGESSDEGDDDSVGMDSEEELKASLQRKKANFVRIAEEIEDYLEREEQAEVARQKDWEQKNDETSLVKKYEQEVVESKHQDVHDDHDGEHEPSSSDNFYMKIGGTSHGQNKSKKVSRFSDPRDTVRNTHLTHVAILSASTKPQLESVADTQVRLDLNQFLRRDITMNELKLQQQQHQQRKARSSSSTSSSSSSSRRSKKSSTRMSSSSKKSSKSKKKRRRSSSSSSSSSSTSSSEEERKRRRRKERRRSRSRDSHRSGRSHRSRSRDRDRRRHKR